MEKRCIGKTLKGKRCCKILNTVGPLCPIHLRTKKGLCIKKSQIPQAGKGLFATKVFKAGSKIDDYKGKIIKKKNFQSKSRYILSVSDSLHIDAEEMTSCAARYANDAKDSKYNNNAQYVSSKKTAWIEAIEDIHPGEEILCEYGELYWDIND